MSFQSNPFYDYRNDYFNRDRQRPRSHSPTPRKIYGKTRHPDYPYHGSRSPVNKLGTHYRPTAFRPYPQRHFTRYYPKSRMQQTPNTFANRQHGSPEYAPYYHSQAWKKASDSTAPIIADKEVAVNPVGHVKHCVEEAKLLFRSDCQTVAEVTQLLITEDSELEERLLTAMKSCLKKIMNSHMQHLKLAKELHTSGLLQQLPK